MGYQIFSEQWATAFRKNINANPDYREKSSGWESPLILKMSEGDEVSSVYLDLWHGRCRSARPGTERDIGEADFVIDADRDTWISLYRHQLKPISALMKGKLKLEKGRLAALMNYSGAAKELLASAARVDTEFGEAQPADGEPAVDNRADTKQEADPNLNGGPDFGSRGAGTLDFDSFPMRLYQKAKKLGIWNPSEIDFETDREHWNTFDGLQKEVLLHLTSLFLAGEEAVTEDLLPLMLVVSREHRVEEELYLTSFLWEEGKHTEFFYRFLHEVTGGETDLSRFHGPSYRKLFNEELPSAMKRLLDDPSPAAQLNASVTYNMIVEGVLAETGYHAYHEMLERNDLLPGLRRGIVHLKRDESRHIAYGIYLLSRLVSENPDLRGILERRMEELLELAMNVINDIFDRYEVMPFGLKKETFVEFALSQFGKRINRIESAGEDQNEALFDSPGE